MDLDPAGAMNKITSKARAATNKLLGGDETPGDAAPDVQYEPPPDQKIMHDGMVVLSADQLADTEAEPGDTDAGDTDARDTDARSAGTEPDAQG